MSILAAVTSPTSTYTVTGLQCACPSATDACASIATTNTVLNTSTHTVILADPRAVNTQPTQTGFIIGVVSDLQGQPTTTATYNVSASVSFGGVLGGFRCVAIRRVQPNGATSIIAQSPPFIATTNNPLAITATANAVTLNAGDKIEILVSQSSGVGININYPINATVTGNPTQYSTVNFTRTF